MLITRYSDQYWPSLVEFLRANYAAMPYKWDRGYFLWRFAGSPLGSALDTYFLAVDAGRVVGQIGTIRDRLWLDDGWQDCYWPVDFMVSGEHRKGTTGIELFQAAMEACPLAISIGFTRKTSAIHKAFHWQPGPGMISRYIVIRPSALNALAPAGGRSKPLIAKGLHLADSIMKPAQIAKTRIYRICVPGLKVEEVDRFERGFDYLLDRALDKAHVHPFRSAEYLKWKFQTRPCGAHYVLVAREAGSREIRGYMAVKLKYRPELARWADIGDFVVLPGDSTAFRTLLNEAVTRAISWGVDFVRIRYTDEEQIPAGVCPPGIPRERATDTVAHHAQSPRIARELNQRRWALTGLASDLMDHGADEWDLAKAG